MGVGKVTTSKPTDKKGAPSKHPGGIDRMVGGKVSKEKGPSHPTYLPGKGGS